MLFALIAGAPPAWAGEPRPAAVQAPNPRAARDKDWKKLGNLLGLSVISEESKTRWSVEFLASYWESPGIKPAMAAAMAAHVPKGPMRRAVEARASGVEWVEIPGGSFLMGTDDRTMPDAMPTHRVTLNPFRMSKTLVTNAQYKACAAAGACSPQPTDCLDPSFEHLFLGGDQPAVCVSWDQAQAFVAWADGRLPSEAEWEYAARGAGDRQYPWGDEAATCERAAIAGCGKATAPVCSKPAGNTPQGLCDMAGNAWEWVEDAYHESYAGAPADGRAWDDSGYTRIARGGLWAADASWARSVVRGIFSPTEPKNVTGFRIAGPPDGPRVLDVFRAFLGLTGPAFDQYSAAFELDKSTAAPSDKAQSWRRLSRDVPKYAETAAKRAARWEAAAAAANKRAKARDSDREKLGLSLLSSAIPPEEKERLSAEYVNAYWISPGIDPEEAAALAAHVVRNDAMHGALVARTPGGKAAVEFVRLPGGTFTMGSADPGIPDARPVHRVTMKSFRISKTLVTNRQYGACVAAGACAPSHVADGRCTIDEDIGCSPGNQESFLGDDQPAICVDWDQAKAFAVWAGGRLPSEAEWEYAARGGGKNRKYPWGDEAPTCERAETANCGTAPAPVCSKPAGNTPQGLCDMAGDAWEMTADWYHDSYDGAPADGGAWDDWGLARVARGGSWTSPARFAKASVRLGEVARFPNYHVGFRIADPPDAPPASGVFSAFLRSDAPAFERFDAAFKLDSSSAAEPSDRASSWRRLARDFPKYAKTAAERAARWEAAAAAGETTLKRAKERDADWEKLGHFLTLDAISDKDKERWSVEFVKNYWLSPGIEPAMAEALAAHVTLASMRLSLEERALSGKAGIQWVKIPGGNITIGSTDQDLERSRPLHDVTVKPFQMSRTPVTNKQYKACVSAGACSPAESYGRAFEGDDQPVVGVDWSQARTFSEWAGGRLPSEAEWESAARGTENDKKYPWGSEDPTCRTDAIGGCGQTATAPVCSRGGDSDQRLCDMAGNVREWVQDWSHATYAGAPTTGAAWENPPGTTRVVRGASWRDDAGAARCAHRGERDPRGRGDYLGFRIAR